MVDEPSTMCWVELVCRNTAEALRFYGGVFGWEAVDHGHHTASIHSRADERPIGNMVSIDELRPYGYGDKPHWVPYFQVGDCDTAVSRAAELGARMMLPPVDVPLGRYSVMADPQGAHLAVITPSDR